MTPSSPPVTAVVGAGPAGLLFTLVARIRWKASGEHDDEWPIYLFDKREAYVRTHRLRIDPAAFEAIQNELRSGVFDELMAFLAASDFRPEVNHLESALASLVAQVGVRKERATIGRAGDELDLPELRTMLERTGRLSAGAPLAVVGADSVHSTTRDLAGGSAHTVARVHHVVARLRVDGDDLPVRLGRIEQFKLAKVLGSALDYRLNSNGFAEVDLFLDPAEHAAVEDLEAKPAAPVAVTVSTVPAAPFFSSVVGVLERGLTERACRVAVHSTFRLEDRHQTQVVFDVPDAGATVLLVGDAAMSLPFFRGMAALAASANALAAAQVAWAEAHRRGDGAAAGEALATYERSVATVRDRELRIVQARSRLVSAATELVRLSALLPFPIQQWLLSRSRPETGGRMTPGAALNMLLATLAGFIAVAAPLVGGVVWPPLGWLWLASVPFQFLGGAVYQATRTLEGVHNPLLATIWRLQLAVLIATGLPITVFTSVLQGRPAQIFGAIGWFILGIVFAAGLTTYERRQRAQVAAADLGAFAT